MQRVLFTNVKHAKSDIEEGEMGTIYNICEGNSTKANKLCLPDTTIRYYLPMNLEKVASQIIFRFQHAIYTTFCQTS